MMSEIDCEAARRTLQDRLDGPIDASRVARLTEHLGTCASCREHEEGLLLVRHALRSLPVVPLPQEDLEAIWARTVEGDGRSHRRWLDWGAVAAAAVIAAMLLLSLRSGHAPSGPTEAEIARATSEARLVFALTAQAMRRSERAAVDDVLTREVSPAVRRIPLRWPEGGSAESRRSG